MHARESRVQILLVHAAETPKAAAPVLLPAPSAKIADVAWLQGYWVGEGMGGAIEDAWLPAKAGVRLTKIAPYEATFGGIVFQREGDKLTAKLTIREKDDSRRVEVLTLTRQPL